MTLFNFPHIWRRSAAQPVIHDPRVAHLRDEWLAVQMDMLEPLDLTMDQYSGILKGRESIYYADFQNAVGGARIARIKTAPAQQILDFASQQTSIVGCEIEDAASSDNSFVACAAKRFIADCNTIQTTLFPWGKVVRGQAKIGLFNTEFTSRLHRDGAGPRDDLNKCHVMYFVRLGALPFWFVPDAMKDKHADTILLASQREMKIQTPKGSKVDLLYAQMLRHKILVEIPLGDVVIGFSQFNFYGTWHCSSLMRAPAFSGLLRCQTRDYV